jgi:serine/threonine-protein kinase RsbW
MRAMIDNNPALTTVCELTVDHDAVVAAIDHAKAFIAEASCSAEAESRLLVLIEEAVSNIIEHGKAPAGSKIRIELAAKGADIGMAITDAGMFFDPRTHHTGAILISERGGGAGIALIKAWSKAIDYEAANGCNTLRLVIANHG